MQFCAEPLELNGFHILPSTDAAKLLGEPIRQEIQSRTGIELAFESVSSVCGRK